MKKANTVKLKNYTSEVPAATSMTKIEKYLVDAGATDISKSYDDRKICSAIVFRLIIDQVPVFFRLPANVDACYEVLKADVKKPAPGTFERVRQQAERTAWKIVSDWVQVQITMIQLEQAKPLQIFLPYVYNPATNETFYDRVQENKKLLEWKS